MYSAYFHPNLHKSSNMSQHCVIQISQLSVISLNCNTDRSFGTFFRPTRYMHTYRPQLDDSQIIAVVPNYLLVFMQVLQGSYSRKEHLSPVQSPLVTGKAHIDAARHGHVWRILVTRKRSRSSYCPSGPQRR